MFDRRKCCVVFHFSLFGTCTCTPEASKKNLLEEYLATLQTFSYTISITLFVGEEPHSSEESKTIVLSAASRPGSRGRKIPLKLLKVKKQSQPQVTFFWSITLTFNLIVKLVKCIKM